MEFYTKRKKCRQLTGHAQHIRIQEPAYLISKPAESDLYCVESYLEDLCFRDNTRSHQAGGIEGLSGHLTQTTALFYNTTGFKFCKLLGSTLFHCWVNKRLRVTQRFLWLDADSSEFRKSLTCQVLARGQGSGSIYNYTFRILFARLKKKHSAKNVEFIIKAAQITMDGAALTLDKDGGLVAVYP